MSAIPNAVDQLIALFSTSLADVTFADTDQQSLSALAEQVEKLSADVKSAEDALDAERLRLAEAQRRLIQHAERALGYARVYAADDPALTRELEGIALGRSLRRSRSTTNGSDGASAKSNGSGKRGRQRRAPKYDDAPTLALQSSAPSSPAVDTSRDRRDSTDRVGAESSSASAAPASVAHPSASDGGGLAKSLAS